jgi:hypothetical protein
MNGSSYDERYTMLIRFHHKFTNRATEWLFACFLLGWAITLFGFPTMFENSNGLQYGGLQVTFGQRGWAFGCAFMGLTRFVALYINGALRATPYIRMLMAFLSCFFWYEISLGLFVSGVPTTSWAMYPVILLFEMYNVLRASSDARQVFDETRMAKDGPFDDK